MCVVSVGGVYRCVCVWCIGLRVGLCARCVWCEFQNVKITFFLLKLRRSVYV